MEGFPSRSPCWDVVLSAVVLPAVGISDFSRDPASQALALVSTAMLSMPAAVGRVDPRGRSEATSRCRGRFSRSTYARARASSAGF